MKNGSLQSFLHGLALAAGSAALLAAAFMPTAGDAARGLPAPAAGPAEVAAFARLAGRADCADLRNVLFVIDGRHVFWDRAGSCIDDAYGRMLYAATPDRELCRERDSRVGRLRGCDDERAKALFEQILRGRGQPDLGLGGGHTVVRLTMEPRTNL